MSGTRRSARFTIRDGDQRTTALFDPARGDAPLDVLCVLAHGAGGSSEHRTTAGLAATLVQHGFDVLRFDFWYRAAGQRPPDRMPRLMSCFRTVVGEARAKYHPKRLVIGGHSMGGRTASMLAADRFRSDGVLLLGYPLHPPGKPESMRSDHLARMPGPTLCVNGTRDRLCTRELMEPIAAELAPSWTMHWVDGADHSFQVLKRSGRRDEDALQEVGRVAREWITTT